MVFGSLCCWQQENESKCQDAPSKRDYFIKTGKQAVQILQTAAKMAPIPFVQEVLGVVLNLIQVCEQVIAIQSQIEDLRDHLFTLGLIIFHSMDRKEVSSGTQKRVERLSVDLKAITLSLKNVGMQSIWRLAFFADINKESVQRCVERLQNTLTEFRLAHDISTEQDLYATLTRLQEMCTQLIDIDKGVKQANAGIEELKALVKSHPHSASSITPDGMPPQLLHFRGRPHIVSEIGQWLCSGDSSKSRVSVLAAGGMGKTTVAVEVMESKAIMEKFGSNNRFWVSCKGAKSLASFLQIMTISLRIKTDTGSSQADILNELGASDHPRLIVLDNFETPWHESKDKQEIEIVLCSLAKLAHVAILITMRSNVPLSCQIHWQVHHLPPLDANASRGMYTDIHPLVSDDYSTLDEFLQALGYMPYAIKLMATLGNESGYSVADLRKMWDKAGTGMLEEDIDRSIGLSVDSTLMNKCPEARSLLVTLSLLPAGTTRDHLTWWVLIESAKLPMAISTLNRTALIVIPEPPGQGNTSNSRIFVYPVVQSYMSKRISAEDRTALHQTAFKFICDHKSNPGDPDFKKNLQILSIEDTNLQGILGAVVGARLQMNDPLAEMRSSTHDDMLLDSLVTFSRYQLYTKARPDIAKLAVELARHLKSNLHLAEALDCLGHICHQIARYDEACNLLKEAKRLFASLFKPLRAAQCTFNLLVSTQFANGNSPLDPLAQELATQCREDVKQKNDPHLKGLAILTLAQHLWALKDYGTALTHLADAQDYFDKSERCIEAGEYFSLIARCWYALGQYSNAYDAAERAATEFEHFGLENRGNRVSLQRGACKLALKCHAEALEIFERCVKTFRKFGAPLGTAQALEWIAQIFEHRQDLEGVRIAYEGALEQYEITKNTPKGSSGHRRCQSNLNVLAAMKEGSKDIPTLEHLNYPT